MGIGTTATSGLGGATASVSIPQKSGGGRISGAWGIMGFVGLVYIQCLGMGFWI